MIRAPGLSVRLKLTLSYAGFLMFAGTVLLGAVWVFLLRNTRRRVIGSLDQVLSNLAVVFDSGFGPRAFVPAAAAVMMFLLVFGLVGGWVLAGRMLAPLARITEATRVAAAGSLSHRIRLQGRKDEFGELADVFDIMLAQLEAHVTAQRRFAANASHELRTPLAITQALLDVGRNDPDRDAGELVERLRIVNARAIELTEALLLLSRTDQRSFARERVDLSLLGEEATETLLALADKRGVTIEVVGEITTVVGSRALLLQLVTNLVHNAIVHNLPDGGVVWVRTGAHAEAGVLTVENTGTQIAADAVATLTEPFQRGAARVRTDHVGLGLGLAIVDSIARAHDGELTLTPRAAGGLRATVRLPSASSPADGHGCG